jgi:hypothetical protein
MAADIIHYSRRVPVRQRAKIKVRTDGCVFCDASNGLKFMPFLEAHGPRNKLQIVVLTV